ncbi:hypothetical protein SRRS_45520 [Sporomusa rhizae]|uniref:hypothetical protein n=1 Tax=Sporomusa rhizae TaxID=357999 RepID=UPI00352AC686
MRKILFILSALLLVIFVQPAFATQDNQTRVLVGFKYYNTSLWGMTTKSVYKDVVKSNVFPFLEKNNCTIVTDEKYFDKLKNNGYSDFSSVERADILEMYKDDGFKYLIFIEMEPIRSSGIGYESSAHVKIIDMQTSKYLFNGKVPGMTKWGGAGTVANNIGKEIRKILEERVFK